MIFFRYENSSNDWSEVLVSCWYLLEIWVLITEPSSDGSTIVTTELINISMNSTLMNVFKNCINKSGMSFINLASICNLFNSWMRMIS